jgi:hypothetical protein
MDFFLLLAGRAVPVAKRNQFEGFFVFCLSSDRENDRAARCGSAKNLQVWCPRVIIERKLFCNTVCRASAHTFLPQLPYFCSVAAFSIKSTLL